jgi:hypothetical protein
MHLNDSKDKLNSNRDRYEHIGLGKIGKEGFRALLKDKAMRKLPNIMETPIDSKSQLRYMIWAKIKGRGYISYSNPPPKRSAFILVGRGSLLTLFSLHTYRNTSL